MWLTLVTVTLISALGLFFAKELSQMAKKINQRPLVGLILLLTLVSFLGIYYQAWLFWLLIKIKLSIYLLIWQIQAMLPLKQSVNGIKVVLLWDIGLIAIGINYFWQKRKVLPVAKSHLFPAIIWLIFMMVIV